MTNVNPGALHTLLVVSGDVHRNRSFRQSHLLDRH